MTATQSFPELVTTAMLPSGVNASPVGSAKYSFASSSSTWSTRPSFQITPRPLVIVHP